VSPFFLAVDPGRTGGFAWSHNGVVGCCNLKVNPADICLQIHSKMAPGNSAETICFFEEVGGYIGKSQPGSAMFRFGRSAGIVEGVLAAFEIPVHRMRPQAWQKTLSLPKRTGGEDKNSHKRRLRALALELYPSLREHITLQTCDALLILHVGKEKANLHEKTKPLERSLPA
jgi:hypothetical protein